MVLRDHASLHLEGTFCGHDFNISVDSDVLTVDTFAQSLWHDFMHEFAHKKLAARPLPIHGHQL